MLSFYDVSKQRKIFGSTILDSSDSLNLYAKKISSMNLESLEPWLLSPADLLHFDEFVFVDDADFIHKLASTKTRGNGTGLEHK